MQWTRRHVGAAVVGAALTALVVGLPKDVVPNPVLGRAVPVPWWSYPMLRVVSVLTGLLLATYVKGTDLVRAAAAPPGRWSRSRGWRGRCAPGWSRSCAIMTSRPWSQTTSATAWCGHWTRWAYRCTLAPPGTPGQPCRSQTRSTECGYRARTSATSVLADSQRRQTPCSLGASGCSQVSQVDHSPWASTPSRPTRP